MSAASPIESALRTLETHAPEPAFSWLQAALQRDPTKPFQTAPFLIAYAGAGRRFGSLADQARACLLMHAVTRLPHEQHVTLVRDVFRQGDNRERIALLQCLSHLPEPERFLETAIEACRTHVQDVFEAIACDNPYAAAHFPDLNFQQLVMKALFTQAPLTRVLGWRERVTSELQRMARDFADERSAAGRDVPTDVTLILDASLSRRTAGGPREAV